MLYLFLSDFSLCSVGKVVSLRTLLNTDRLHIYSSHYEQKHIVLIKYNCNLCTKLIFLSCEKKVQLLLYILFVNCHWTDTWKNAGGAQIVVFQLFLYRAVKNNLCESTMKAQIKKNIYYFNPKNHNYVWKCCLKGGIKIKSHENSNV